MNDDFLEEIRTRNMERTLLSVLDVIEPFAPLAAGVLWILQPVAGIYPGGADFMGNLAHVLDNPDEVTRLRNILEKPADSP